MHHAGWCVHYSYTVSDGAHEVRSVVTIIASEPFIRIQNNNITISTSNTSAAAILVPLTNHNLSVATNVDGKNSDICFQVATRNWIFVNNSTKRLVKNFTQQVSFPNILKSKTIRNFDGTKKHN